MSIRTRNAVYSTFRTSRLLATSVILAQLMGYQVLAEPAGSPKSESVAGRSAATAAFQTEGLSPPAAIDTEPDATVAPGDKEPLPYDPAVEASKRFNKALEHFNIAGKYFSRWELDLAELELEVAIMHNPDLKVAHRDLCLVSLCKGNLLRSLAEFTVVVGLGEPIPLNDQEKLDLSKRALKTHYRRALMEGAKNEWLHAIEELKVAKEYDQLDPRIDRSLAFAYANIGDFDLSEKFYASTLSKSPTDPLARAEFADVLSAEGETDRAIQQMSHAVRLAPSATALHVDLGWLAEAKGDLDTAGKEFEIAVRLSPNHAGLWAHLGKILANQGRSSEAQRAYDQALSLDPQQSDAREGLARLKS